MITLHIYNSVQYLGRHVGDSDSNCKAISKATGELYIWEVFGQMGTIMSDDDIDRLMTLCDKDHDGLINYEEFLDRV